MAVSLPVDRYALYGEPVPEVELDFMHIEPIAVRSRRFSWTIEPHSHAKLHQILLVTAGGGSIQVEADSHSIHPPAVLVVPSGAVHGFRFLPDTDGWVASISDVMSAEVAGDDPAISNLFDRAHAVSAVTDVANTTILQAFETLSRELVWSAPARQLAIRAELLRLLVTAARLVHSDHRQAPGLSGDAILTDRFRRLVEQDFRRGLPISAYARTLGVSDDRLLAACTRRLREPPVSIVHRRVLVEAQRWLIYTAKAVGEISRELGFVDAAYFSRFFKKKVGETPRAYRFRMGRNGPRTLSNDRHAAQDKVSGKRPDQLRHRQPR